MRTTGMLPGLSLLAGAVLLAGCASGPSIVTVNSSVSIRQPMSLAVLDFDWQPPAGTLAQGHTMISAPNAGKYVADNLSSRLLELDCFQVMERSRLGALLGEKDLSQSELISQGRYQEIGKLLQADYLVLGTVNSYTTWANGFLTGHAVSFSCRCVEVRTGQLVWTLDGKMDVGPFGPPDPAWGLSRILDDAIPKLRSQLGRCGQAASPSALASSRR